jgi:LacI family transcriptional regulator
MSVLLGNSDESAAREASYLDLFREQRVNGVLITPTGDDLATLERMQDAGVPVVLVDRELPDSAMRSVAVDDVEGGYLAASHLLSLGRTRIAYVCGPRTTPQVADRLEGAERAVAENPDARIEVVELPALTVLQGRAAGEAIVARARADRPDAIFAANDLLAVGLLQALSLMADVRVPDDIALIGYDDIDFAAATVVPLSSIRQPAHLIGHTAVDLLLRGLDGEDEDETRNVRFRPELVVRASTAG